MAPAPTTERFSDLRFSDLYTVLAIHRHESITKAARELRVTPSQVSKAIRRVEAQLHLEIILRSSRGVTLSEAGRRVLPFIKDAVSRIQDISRHRDAPGIDLTIAAPSWLSRATLTSIATAQPDLRLRALELPPALLAANAADGVFELTLVSSGVERFPQDWSRSDIGVVRKALFASPNLAKQLLGPGSHGHASVDALKKVPFISPVSSSNGQFVLLDDECPLRLSARTVGHQAQTVAIALELAAHTDQLVFGPEIAAREYVSEKRLVEIPVKGWNISDPIYLMCNADRVLARVQTSIVRALRSIFT